MPFKNRISPVARGPTIDSPFLLSRSYCVLLLDSSQVLFHDLQSLCCQYLLLEPLETWQLNHTRSQLFLANTWLLFLEVV